MFGNVLDVYIKSLICKKSHRIFTIFSVILNNVSSARLERTMCVQEGMPASIQLNVVVGDEIKGGVVGIPCSAWPRRLPPRLAPVACG